LLDAGVEDLIRIMRLLRARARARARARVRGKG